MAELSCDVLVIGGGATGVCAAYDAARRGLRVILAEMNDLSTGTSGRFHGLLHSGARYAVRDPESARECILENAILRRIAPHIIEDTGGLFVAVPGDPADYVPRWLEACAAAGIAAEAITVREARRQEPALSPALVHAFRVPDGAVDGFDMAHAFTRAAEDYGATTLIYHEVTALNVGSTGVMATLQDRRSGEEKIVSARWVINAAGPWAGKVAALAGYALRVAWSRGAMIAMNTRWVNTVINRLRPPTDGDILVPVGTVSVIGTTSIPVERPDDNTIEPWEITALLDEGEAIIPGFRQARALRAWAGVRPLYEAEAREGITGRAVRRTFDVIRHAPGLTTVVGGKLTTARLMAEKAVDDVCAGLGIEARCTTADEPLPGDHPRRLHMLGSRLDALEHGRMPGPLICECEMVTQAQIEEAIAAYARPPALDDLRRDLRLGMGPCQGGFCAVRAAGIVQRACNLDAAAATAALRAFVDERFKGGRSLLWGHHLRQFLLDEMIYRRTLGLDRLTGAPPAVRDAPLPAWAADRRPVSSSAQGRRVIVIGAGMAGLMAALHAVRAGAQVHVIAAGIGRLILAPGWCDVGPFHDHPGVRVFLDWCTDHGVRPLAGGPAMLGTRPAVSWAGDGEMLIVGFASWRDFYPMLCAGNLARQGIPARGIHVDLPRRHDGWDLSPTRLAHCFDDPAFREEVARLVKGRLRDEARVGFPAVLGLRDPAVVQRELAEQIGRPVFEIPTLPPSVPGTRLLNVLKGWLLRQGARVQIGHAVTRPVVEGRRVVGVAVASVGRETVFHADAVILATGGLYGGGLLSDDRGRLWEPIFDLPVQAQTDRLAWFNTDLLDLRGHPAHTFGIAVDEYLRPLGKDGTPAYENLFAAGHILGGMDTLIGGCEEGFDLASAYTAVREALGND